MLTGSSSRMSTATPTSAILKLLELAALAEALDVADIDELGHTRLARNVVLRCPRTVGL